ncbi:AAA family ATPase [Corynebacterium sp.]|uniref:AAA family ATPase n=1 Tax=Corynebacterium sp. TaxID=1720 RepID=UPI003735CCF9
MRIHVENLGPVKRASWDLRKLNVLAGPNSSGKTYLAHAVYAALKATAWPNSVSFISPVDDSVTQAMTEELSAVGRSSVKLSELADFFDLSFKAALEAGLRGMYRGISGESIRLVPEEGELLGIALQRIRSGPYIPGINFGNFSLNLQTNDADDPDITLTKQSNRLDTEQPGNDGSAEAEEYMCGRVQQFLGLLAPWPSQMPYVLTSERVGLYTFQSDIDYGRSEMVEKFRVTNGGSAAELSTTPWPSAVEDNLDQFRRLQDKNHRAFMKPVPEAGKMIDLIHLMSGGQFHFEDGSYTFAPKDSDVHLPMSSTSSTARSLFELAEFVTWHAQPGAWIVIDEPELNLHPDNQVLMARLLAHLVDAEVSVFLTTHSDYLLRELSILTVLNSKEEWPEEYQGAASLNPDDIRVGYTELQNGVSSLKAAEVSPLKGIHTPFFDGTIARQNRLFDEVVWGG